MDTQKLLLLLKYILNKQPLSECPVVSQDWKDLLALAKQHNVPYFAKLPIDPAIAAKVDAGKIEAVSGELISGLMEGIVKVIG